MSFSVRCVAAAALLRRGVAVAGCGETVIDNAKAEGAIQYEPRKVAFTQKITSVDCPSEQKVEPGATFTCTVDLLQWQAGDCDSEDPQQGRRRQPRRPQAE